MSVYTQSQRPLAFNTSTKTLTGFGPASSAERYLKVINVTVTLIIIIAASGIINTITLVLAGNRAEA